MRNLEELPAAGFDAVICMDNALPHLLTGADLTQAVVATANESVMRSLPTGLRTAGEGYHEP